MDKDVQCCINNNSKEKEPASTYLNKCKINTLTMFD